MQREGKIEKAVKEYAARKKFYVRKFKSPGNRGVPDKLFISPRGETFFIEFKDPKGKLSELQKDEIFQIRKRGAIVYVVDSIEHGKAIIDIRS